MEENISCEIIRDLLPSYIEEIVSDETKKLISNHLDRCICCKKEWENMIAPINVEPVEERKIKYLKKIHKKFRNILLTCSILSVIMVFIAVFSSEVNVEEVLFTLVGFFILIVLLSIRFGLPLLVAVVCFFKYKKTKKKWLLFISVMSACLFIYSLFSVVKSIMV